MTDAIAIGADTAENAVASATAPNSAPMRAPEPRIYFTVTFTVRL
ncbi:MAG TPA: hypothetical protein VLW51_10100 [Solirubrobacteraceae bacterium]|nr:hypothetical protein [Solirubrobacteraceae bacterium]